MERILALYAHPYDPKRPLLCFDERPCVLRDDVLAPEPMRPTQPRREDYHYRKHGSCSLLMAFEPATGQRWAKVYQRRTAKEYTDFMQYLAAQFPAAEHIELVQDNLSTHQGGSFYAHLPPEQAFALAEHFAMHFTPKGASWLNMIELEFSVLAKQCLDRRIPNQQRLEHEVLAWARDRNLKRTTVSWQFSIADARTKLARHYPDLKVSVFS